MNKFFFPVVTLALAFLASASSISVSSGQYAAVSESEWSMDLELKENHIASLELGSWEPGEADRPSNKIYLGKWEQEGSAVKVKFKEGEVVFNSSPKLSFEEFGHRGSAPGLVGVSSTFERALFVKRSLWLKSELSKIRW